jgi:hypothetical protein
VTPCDTPDRAEGAPGGTEVQDGSTTVTGGPPVGDGRRRPGRAAVDAPGKRKARARRCRSRSMTQRRS